MAIGAKLKYCCSSDYQTNMETNSTNTVYRVIKRDAVDDHEFFQVVLVRSVVAMPRHDVER